MRVLVTGADGFVGRHLCARLERAAHELVRASGPTSVAGHESLDVTVADSVEALVQRHRPDAVVHLAGFSSVGASHREPLQCFRVNALGTVHLLESLRRHAPACRVLLVSSGEVYGQTALGELATETSALQPLSPYASSKAAAEVVGLQYARLGQHVMVARPFNHLGRGQHPGFVLPTFAAQLRAIGRGEQPPRLAVGNLEPIRDFSHVDDVVDAYALLLTQGKSGTITNVSSGVGRSVRQLLEQLISTSGLAVTVEVDPARFRPSDAAHLVGSSALLRSLGWMPTRTVDEAIAEVYAEEVTA